MIKFIENKLVPILIKIGENKILVAVRNGITLTLPFTISGSLFLILANLPIPGWSDFLGPFADKLSAPVAVTFGAIGIISAIGISYNLAKQYKLDAITCSAITMVVFLLAQLDQEYTLNVDNLGAAGLFSAIILSIITVHIIKFFISRNIVIKLPEGVPPAVAQSFAGLVPAAVAIVLIWFIRVLLNFDINAFFTWLLSPLVMGLGTLPGMLILIFLISILWCCGIHGDNVLSGITSPIFLKYIAENTQAYLNHQPIPHITADGFYIVFMCLGGTGATLGLVISMLRSKSKLYKSVGELSLPSAIFCINEPVIFGFPIVFNPIMMIPFTITPMILCTLTYALMYFNIIGRPVLQIPWTMPPIFAAYFVTGGNIPAVIWSVCTIVISVFVFLPFFKMAEKKQLEKEEAESRENLEPVLNSEI
ncbi:PTS system oligo-beta-mannoside-specific EIIC component [Sebaldella termitidis]|jgi:cellobiose PTS system EIIC component|uniref:Permease IIC component n=1 Tax=Sebaldella termitidis (strain ATCC 33386 / NCTC 11300) TaxID=526218 RepID=D1AG78_SEBTE|nr:PTS transporter subunit EIIC [Sebaldella termitidis]ACZ10704.1 PTS system, lactose/cellobiose family IIC subunit [Sebaldella termitidis ATCC 33386]MBP7979192.1 PTS sugar transporter subunit IIC [Sebaldella sp.]SUI26045.1 PTS system oligo-beta-mannoside-specific EIIC component [Sebaldella termitidis]